MKLNYPGVPVYMNGQNYYIPSLSTRDFRDNYEALSNPPAADSSLPQAFHVFVPIILLAIKRNYPEVTQDQLEDWLDLYTFKLAIRAMQDASGMTPVSEGE